MGQWHCLIPINDIPDIVRHPFYHVIVAGLFLSAPFSRSEPCRAKGDGTRKLIKLPPSSHCDLCVGLNALMERCNVSHNSRPVSGLFCVDVPQSRRTTR